MIDARIQMRSRFSRELVLKPANIVIGLEDEIFVKGLHDIIENQIENSGFSVDQLANAVGLSTRQLYRRIHSISGQTPGQLIRAYRLQKAHLLLETRPGSISEVGFAVGFKSPSHFSASFREMYGYTPTELVSSLT
jgi:AraC-like DNA-binding protein